VSAARHRAAGRSGRSVAFHTARPRHAAPAASRAPAIAGAGLALMLGPIAGGLAAVAVGALRGGPSLSPPTPTSSQPAPPTSAPRQGVPHAVALRSPVLLGPLTRGRLSSYCRATHGPDTTAALDDGDWMCWPPDTGRGLIDMDAVCRWRYGDDGWAGMTDDDDPTAWRCYRDPS
jgi:hypothetical protein